MTAPQYADEIAALDKREREIVEEMGALTAELRALRNARGAMRTLDTLEKSPARGTYALLREYISTLPPDTMINAEQAVTYMVNLGWETTTWNRTSAVYMALSKLLSQSEVARKRNVPRRYFTLAAIKSITEPEK